MAIRGDTQPISITVNINDYFSLIGYNGRINEYLKQHPNFPVDKVSTRLYVCNLPEAMEYHRGVKLNPKEEYQQELNRKIKLEADLLEIKKEVSDGLLVDPVLAIEQIQRDYATIKDKIISMKMVLIHKCENKDIIELDKIFTKYITQTLELLSSESRIKRTLEGADEG